MKSTIVGTVLAAFAACLIVASSANATALRVVAVSAPAINCVFNTSCTLVVADSVGHFSPLGDVGDGRLQSRTYDGVAPTSAADMKGYEYRLDMTSVQASSTANCVTQLRLDFGPAASLQYDGAGSLDDVYVVTSGGLGSVAISSATRRGRNILLVFGAPVCPGQTSFFFGLTSRNTSPVPATATISFSLGGSAEVAVRTPSH